MQLQFPKKTVTCLERVKAEIQTLEETQELRMPEEMPDIGKVLGTWGQVVLRGKQWRDESMAVSGGVMTWILYLPEGEGQEPQTVQAWIPFQMKCDLPETKRDGAIRVLPLLKSVDARSTSARKMIARATVSLLAEAFVQEDVAVSTPEELPEDIQLLKNTYPLCLPKEAGEKEFSMDEELTLPSSAPKLSKIVHFSLHPELIDRKVLSGKVVFRGVGLLHLLYLDENGRLCSWDFEIPYSQYGELDGLYEQEADTRVLPVLTGMELDAVSEDKLRLKASLIGQYVIYDTQPVTLAVDAYSTRRDVEITQAALDLPAFLESKQLTVRAEHSLHQTADKIADVVFYPDLPRVRQNKEEATVDLSGVFQVIIQDDQGALQGITTKWSAQQMLPSASGVEMEVTSVPSGAAQATISSGEIRMSRDICLESMAVSTNGIPMVTQIELGQLREPDGNRPSLILRRCAGKALWELAKQHGSTVDAIIGANHLAAKPDDNQMLLIPVV